MCWLVCVDKYKKSVATFIIRYLTFTKGVYQGRTNVCLTWLNTKEMLSNDYLWQRLRIVRQHNSPMNTIGAEAQQELTVVAQKLKYFGTIRLLTLFLISWLLALPGHQQTLYWLCRINQLLSPTGKYFNNTCHIAVEECKHEFENEWHRNVFVVRTKQQ